jgi:uncharacterized membrane protein
MLRASRVARGVAIGAGAIAYAVLAHLSNATPGHEVLGALLAVGPLCIAAVVLAWRSRFRVLALSGCVLVGIGVFVRRADLEAHFAWLYLAQQAGTYALLGVTFGRTLGAGRTPLCARFAAIVHGPLSPPVAAYTRSVTVAWTVFFALVVVALALLYFLAPLKVWSAFANFGVAVLLALMFAIEYIIRRRVLPNMQHYGILATIRAISTVTLNDPVATPRG